ncbi:MAG: ATP-binding cassette domain-containing protein, partial [Verrucomicrobiota bacterium]
MMPWLELEVALPLPDFELKVSFRTTSSVLGIFGPSGAGKSSLLESIVGIRKTVRGSIRVKGVTWLDDNTTLPAFRRRVGWVPQNHRLFPHWTVRRNLLAGRSGSLRAEQASKDFFEKSVDLLELGPLLERMPESLSGG